MKEKIYRPSFQFYPNDWICDLELQSCSLAAQGLWINLMCRMHKSVVYGKLLLEQNGKQISISGDKLAGLVGRTFAEVEPLIEELVSVRVMKVDLSTGIYFCSRMVKDEDIRNKRAEAGAKGGASTQSKNNSFAKAKNKSKLKQTVEEEDEEGVEDEKENNLIERKIKFSNQVEEFTDFPAELRKTFIDYWTEHNHNGKKMRFEMEPVFDFKKRLNTFLKNDNKRNFKNNNTSSQESNSHLENRLKQNVEQKEINKLIFKDERIG